MFQLPPERIELDSPIAAPELLRRFRAEAEDWHESKLAPEARRAGITGYRFRTKPNSARTVQLWTKPQPIIVCELVLEPTVNGVRCIGEMRLTRGLRIGLGLWAALGVLGTLGGAAAALMHWDTFGERVASALGSCVGLVIVCGLGYGLLHLWWHMGRLQRAELKRLIGRVTASTPDALVAAV